MEETRELLLELAEIMEEWCRNQIRTLNRVADNKDLPPGLREDILERVRFMRLGHHKVEKLIEKAKSTM